MSFEGGRSERSNIAWDGSRCRLGSFSISVLLLAYIRCLRHGQKQIDSLQGRVSIHLTLGDALDTFEDLTPASRALSWKPAAPPPACLLFLTLRLSYHVLCS